MSETNPNPAPDNTPKAPVAAAAPAPAPAKKPAADMSRGDFLWAGWGMLAAFLAVLLVAPVMLDRYLLSVFFLIFTAIPMGAGVVLMLLNPLMKKWMHGVH